MIVSLKRAGKRRAKVSRIRAALTQSFKGVEGFAAEVKALREHLDKILARLDARVKNPRRVDSTALRMKEPPSPNQSRPAHAQKRISNLEATFDDLPVLQILRQHRFASGK